MYANATMHTPEDVTADALKYAEEVSADCAVSVPRLKDAREAEKENTNRLQSVVVQLSD